MSGKNNTAGASVNTTVRPVKTAGSKTTVNHPRPISNAYKKGYSQVTRPFNKYSENKNSIFNKKVNTVRVKDTTARDRAVVSKNKGKGLMLLRPRHAGHITGNKCYLTEYEVYDGGFVSFGDDKCRISRKGEGRSLHFLYFSLLVPNLWIVEETLNIKFLENAPNVKGNGPDWLFDVDYLTISMNYVPVVAGNQTNGIARNRDNIVAGQAKKKIEPKQEYILIPLCTTDLLISQDPKDKKVNAGKKAIKVDESGVLDNDGKDEQATRSESERLIQKEMHNEHINSTNSINTVSTPVSTAGPSFANAAPSSSNNAAGTPDSTTNAFEEHLFE
ncbi:hypothetical protein Tco_1136377 [Tanacetum coccineum]